MNDWQFVQGVIICISFFSVTEQLAYLKVDTGMLNFFDEKVKLKVVIANIWLIGLICCFWERLKRQRLCNRNGRLYHNNSMAIKDIGVVV